MKKRITFKIKTVYYLELLTNEMMKLLGSTENKYKKGENIPYLEMIEVVLVQHCQQWLSTQFKGLVFICFS